MIVAANVPRKFENCTKVAVLDGLILHSAMDYEDDFDSINSQTVTLQFSAKHVDMDMEQSTQPIIIAHIFLDAATVWLQDQISSQIYIPDAREV